MKTSNMYVGYDYKKVVIDEDTDYQYLDSLKCFGWELDEEKTKDIHTYILKRSTHIVNKTELLRLERNLDVCKNEIVKLQKSVYTQALFVALGTAFLGTVFMTLSTFAVVYKPPRISLCIMFAIPGFIGWILPYFIYRFCKKKRSKKIERYVEERRKEMETVCNKAIQLIQ